MTRTRLSNRRLSETRCFEWQGLRGHATCSWPSLDSYNTEALEIFLDVGKEGSGAKVSARESATAASLALQYGCPMSVLMKALQKLDNENPAGPLGTALAALMGEPT